MQISAQMAQQIAEANALQLSAPEMAKPVAHSDNKQKETAVSQSSIPGDNPLPTAGEIQSSMTEALNKYQQIYTIPD